MSQNRAFQEMLRPALDRLKGRDAEELAKNTQIKFDEEKKEFVLSSLGQGIRISYPEFEISPALDEWHHLVLLHYMDLADGTKISGELMTFGELPNGMVRGGGFDRQSERTLSLQLGNASLDKVQKACEKLGAKLTDSHADLCAVFYVFPLYPVTLNLWFADEEIPGSARLMLDKSAGHFLSVEDAVTIGTLIMELLLKTYREIQ